MKIGLIGFQGVGKTTLGAKLSSALGLPHIDLDDEVCRDLKVSSPKIAVEQFGLEKFREIERAIALDYAEVVLSFGGGALNSIKQAHRLDYSLLYLYLPYEEFDFSHAPQWLQQREFISVWNERHPIFSSVAEHTLYAKRGEIDSLLQEVLTLYGK